MRRPAFKYDLRVFRGDLAGALSTAVVALPFTLVLLIGWQRRLGRFLPAPLVVLLAGTLMSVFWLDRA